MDEKASRCAPPCLHALSNPASRSRSFMPACTSVARGLTDGLRGQTRGAPKDRDLGRRFDHAPARHFGKGIGKPCRRRGPAQVLGEAAQGVGWEDGPRWARADSARFARFAGPPGIHPQREAARPLHLRPKPRTGFLDRAHRIDPGRFGERWIIGQSRRGTNSVVRPAGASVASTESGSSSP